MSKEKLSKKWNVSEEEIVENMLDVDILLGYEDTVSRHKERQLQSRILELEQKLELKCEAHQKEMEAVVGEIKEEVDNWDWDIDPTYCKNIKRNIDKIAQKHNINIGDEMDTPM